MSIDLNDDHYLDKLLEILQSITTDVENVYMDENGYYADYGNNSPSEEEIADVNAILDNWSSNKERFIKLHNEQVTLENNIQSGYTVPSDLLSGDSGGWTIKSDTNTIAILSMQLLLANHNNQSSVSVIDTTGTSHSISLSNMQTLMTAFNTHANGLRQTFASNVQTINNTFNNYDGGGGFNKLLLP
jgi:hypothetical protein